MRHEGTRGRGGYWPAAGLAVLLGLAAPGAARAEDPARDAVPRPVSRDALFKLPPSTPAPDPVPAVGGATRKEWQERFGQARADVQAAETRLAEAQAELETLASGNESWQVAAPGAAASDTGPLSFSLRQEIRRAREEVDRTQQALSELRIEANLAGVPAEWIGEDAPPQAP